MVGDTVEEAQAKSARSSTVSCTTHNAIASLSIALGHDASKFDPDGPLPDIPETNASKSGRERAIALAKRENLTVRQLAQRLGGYSGSAMVGTPKTIADQMEEWLDDRRLRRLQHPCSRILPAGLDDFVDRVVPELQRRGLFRTRIRRQDPARKSRPAAAGEPLLLLTATPRSRNSAGLATNDLIFRLALFESISHFEDHVPVSDIAP